MALIYSDSIKSATLGQGILSAIGNNYASSLSAISVYSGTQPAASDITANWSQYNSTNSSFLVHYTGSTWYLPATNLITISTYPAATAAINSGTGTWAIIWATNITTVQAAGSALPSANFLVVPCSSTAGSGVIRFIDNVFTAGDSKVITDGSIKATF